THSDINENVCINDSSIRYWYIIITIINLFKDLSVFDTITHNFILENIYFFFKQKPYLVNKEDEGTLTKEGGRTHSIFFFLTVPQIAQRTVEELLV
ncbi:hypothetical protein ACJX0J_009465, partial [Zea mays]